MHKKGLSSEEITRVASEMIAENGCANFSLRELAAKLGVRPASLYNHVSGIGEINVAVALDASTQMHHRLEAAVEGLLREQAFLRGLAEYRAFAAENPELYKLLYRLAGANEENAALIRKAALYSIEPLRRVVKQFELDEADMIHFMRFLRSTLYGFITLTSEGFLLRGGVPRDESYAFLSRTLLTSLEALSEKNKAQNAEKGEEKR
ncbi:MAG: WHG domain-containing protein [Clostridia bacterium]|nr:WHG domain-containing protein [Clostridia bacterium]